jgi:CRISPR-associated protein Cas6
MAIIELKYPILGTMIPSDHGYRLYGAICKILPEVHEMKEIAICGISGIPDHNRTIHLQSASKLRFRIPSETLPILLKLSGKKLNIGDSKISLGIPKVSLLRPHKSLYSRLVLINTPSEFTQESFTKAVKRQLLALGIEQDPVLFYSKPGYPYLRKTIRVKDKELVGYPIIVPNLNPDESILLQEKGLGGKRKMGCGTFLGVRL